MAKEIEKLQAKQHYFKFKPQNEIARIVKVQPKTIGDWIKKYGWKKERDARFNGSKTQIENIKSLIAILTEQRIELVDDINDAKEKNDTQTLKELQITSNKIADEVAKYNKALQNFEKENRVSLSTYIEVMDQIFNAIQVHDANIYMKLLTFQEEHLSDISLKLG